MFSFGSFIHKAVYGLKKLTLMSAVLLPAFVCFFGCGRDTIITFDTSEDDTVRQSSGGIDLVGLIVPDVDVMNYTLVIENDYGIPGLADFDEGSLEDGYADNEFEDESGDEDEGMAALPGEENLPESNTVYDINGQMHGIWVATVINIDYPSGSGTTDSSVLRKKADDIIENCASMGINNIFLQVRPASDAFYRSDIYPWSRYLTGTQGAAPSDGFDPLEYWIKEAHARGIGLHAWINPYRITKSKNDYATLDPSNPAILHPEWTVIHKGNYYFNPGLPEVRQLVTEGVLEIVRNYDVDGIHFDDYFYPNEGGENFADDEAYAMYGAGFSSKGAWRRDNVDQLVRSLRPAIRQIKPDVVFGISPSGIWANSTTMSEGSRTAGQQAYTQLYADTRKWAREEWIDYIAPQLYWEIGFDKADYSILVDWWSRQLEGVTTKLYIGLPDYRTVEGKKAVWSGESGVAQIQKQMELNKSYPNISGEIHYNYSSVMKNGALPGYYASIYK